MTLHAEVIVFCNDFGWLVGGKSKRKGLEKKQPSQSWPFTGALWVQWPEQWTGGGQFRIVSWSWLSKAASLAGEHTVTDTAGPSLAPKMGCKDGKDEVSMVWATGVAAEAEAVLDAQHSLMELSTSISPCIAPSALSHHNPHPHPPPGPPAVPNNSFTHQESDRNVLGCGFRFFYCVCLS